MDTGRLALRIVAGGLLIGHGTQKLFGWFEGSGPAGTQKMMAGLKLYPPKVHATASGLAETGSGLLLATGLAAPLAAAGVTSVMTTAIAKVHRHKGVWSSEGGWEYNAVLIAAVAALAEAGPGRPSLDEAMRMHWHGPRWAVAAVAGGAAAAGLVIRMSGLFRPDPDGDSAGTSHAPAAAPAPQASSAGDRVGDEGEAPAAG